MGKIYMRNGKWFLIQVLVLQVLWITMSEYVEPIILVLGTTGSGKSTICNILSGRNPYGNDPNDFPVSVSPDACTNETNIKECNWLGIGPKFTIVDTPGLDDPAGRDTENISEMAKKLKEMKRVNVFLIVMNSQKPRLDGSLKSMLQIFKNMFGPKILENTIIEFSRWSYDEKSTNQRKTRGISEMKYSVEWNEIFSEEFGLKQNIPTVFIDGCYEAENALEVAAFKEQTTELFELSKSMCSFECKDVENVMSERDEFAALARKEEKQVQALSCQLKDVNSEKRNQEKYAENMKKKLKNADSELSRSREAASLKRHTMTTVERREKEIREQCQERREQLARAEIQHRREEQRAQVQQRVEVAEAVVNVVLVGLRIALLFL